MRPNAWADADPPPKQKKRRTCGRTGPAFLCQATLGEETSGLSVGRYSGRRQAARSSVLSKCGGIREEERYRRVLITAPCTSGGGRGALSRVYPGRRIGRPDFGITYTLPHARFYASHWRSNPDRQVRASTTYPIRQVLCGMRRIVRRGVITSRAVLQIS